MAVDWLKIKSDYINGGGSYRKLAEKYEVSFNTLQDRAKREGWKEQKESHHDKITTNSLQKTEEKISDALSNEAAAKVRIRGKLIRMAEKWIDSVKETIDDTGDYRRIVQSCIELGIMNTQDAGACDGDGLLDALANNAESLFVDGDDSGMLPEEKE